MNAPKGKPDATALGGFVEIIASTKEAAQAVADYIDREAPKRLASEASTPTASPAPTNAGETLEAISEDRLEIYRLQAQLAAERVAHNGAREAWATANRALVATEAELRAERAIKAELVAALEEAELMATQAQMASRIGRKRNRTDFLTGELERIKEHVRSAITATKGEQ